MPHHSSHRQQGASSEMPFNQSLYSPQVHPLQMMREQTTAHIMRPTTHGAFASPTYYHTAEMVTPMKSTSWVSSTPLGRPMPSFETPNSSNSSERSSKQAGTPVSSLSTDSDEMESREATASALLLVSTKCKLEQSKACNDAHIPLKKRKNLDFLRPKTSVVTTAIQEPCHVSPVSQTSLDTRCVSGRTISKEEQSPERIPTSAVRTDSYDSKESPCGNMSAAQALLDSSKINNTSEIATSSESSIPHFPSSLHQVLSNEKYSGTVVQWLEDGESWKVLRWDALRREILPQHFAHLTDENGGGSGTIDAFLWHLSAWGFEELDDGSYRHELFIRGAQKLCRRMKCTAVPAVVQQSRSVKPVSPLRNNRAILQVPSLSTPRPHDEYRVNSQPNKRARHALGRPARPQHLDATGWGRFYAEAQQVGMRHANGQFAHAYDPRYGMDHLSQPYSPPQVTRSSRGRPGITRPTSSVTPSNSTITPTQPRTSFPVSNRGKGNRKGSMGRVIPQSSDSPIVTPVPPVTPLGATHHGVAMAVSKKSKRKLPLTQKTEAN